MSQTYTYSVSGDTLNGKVYAKNLRKEIQDSTITIALDGNLLDVIGDVLEIHFKVALSTSEKTTLDSIVSAHTGENGTEEVQHVKIDYNVGNLATYLDGLCIEAPNSNTWYHLNYPMLEAWHIHGAVLSWKGCFGDIAHMAIINNAAMANPTAQANTGSTSVELNPALVPYYAPENGCTHIEIWDNSGQIIEVRPVASASGTTVTLSNGHSFAYDVLTSNIVYPRIGGYCPIRGLDGIDGGIRLVGDGTVYYQNTHGMTNKIPPGLSLSMRMKTNATVGTRYFAINYDFRG